MKQFSVAMLALGIMLAAVPAARADTTCSNQTLNGSTVNGNLIVPPGATCTLIGVAVTGNVQVLLNATLDVSSQFGSAGATIDGNLRVGTGASLGATSPFGPPFLTVGGNVSADQCAGVGMRPAKVGGNVEIQNSTDVVELGPSIQIGGNFDCSNNSIPCTLVNSSVNGNVQINDNKGTSEVGGNTIGGNLQCQGNALIGPFGELNTVAGHKEGQCAGF